MQASEASGERPRIFRQRRVVGVGEPGAVSLVRQEHVPEPALARQILELLHDLRLVVGVAGLAQLPRVGLLGSEYVLLHEGAKALLECAAALAVLEVHRSSFSLWGGSGSGTSRRPRAG